jgi:hypothetical protein
MKQALDDFIDMAAAELRELSTEGNATPSRVTQWLKRLGKVLDNAPPVAIEHLLINYNRQTQMQNAPCRVRRGNELVDDSKIHSTLANGLRAAELGPITACPYINGGELMLEQLRVATDVRYEKEDNGERTWSEQLRYYIRCMVKFYNIPTTSSEGSPLVKYTKTLIEQSGRAASARDQVREAIKKL